MIWRAEISLLSKETKCPYFSL